MMGGRMVVLNRLLFISCHTKSLGVVCSIVSTALYNFEKSKIYVYDGKLTDERLISDRKELLKIIKENDLEFIS